MTEYLQPCQAKNEIIFILFLFSQRAEWLQLFLCENTQRNKQDPLKGGYNNASNDEGGYYD